MASNNHLKQSAEHVPKPTGSGRIYLDYAAATPVLSNALLATTRAFSLVGNPGALHTEGVQAAEVLETARARLAKHLGVRSHTLVFTSGGTEANNLAILGHLRALESAKQIQGAEYLFSVIEHPSVLACAAEIKKAGGIVLYIRPDKTGHIKPEDVADRVSDKTALVSVGWANGEIGAVQPLRAISQAIKAKNPHTVVHSDLGQAPLYLASDIFSLGIDLATLDSSKLYGPRGVGVLYIKDGTTIESILFGGKQERGIRPGSENVALAEGMSFAYEMCATMRENETRRLQVLKKSFLEMLLAQVPQAVLNTCEPALPHMINISIPGVSTEYVTLALDHRGIAVSTKSSCREGEESYSHVVLALENDTVRAQSTLRISLGTDTTIEELSTAVSQIVDILQGPGVL